MGEKRAFWAVLGLLLVTGSTLEAQEVGEQVEWMGVDGEVVEMSAPVSRTFYTGSFNYYYYTLSGTLASSGYGTTSRGGTISYVTACLVNTSYFSRTFRATASVKQGAGTIQSITFQRSFPDQQITCHQLSGFNAVVLPGEFQVEVSYNGLEVDNFWTGLPVTSNGQVFDVQVGSARPPYATGPQGPIRINGVGVGYRIAENDPPPPCAPDNQTLCFMNGRFEVKATYTDYGNNTGAGQAVALTPDSGYFWFFDASNVEAVGKVVSFCPINGSFGFYAGGLTDVGVEMTVRDTVADQTQTFTNDRGHNFDMISSAFNTCGILRPQARDASAASDSASNFDGESVAPAQPAEISTLLQEAVASALSRSVEQSLAPSLPVPSSAMDDENSGYGLFDSTGSGDGQIASTISCIPDLTTLCLLGDRFEVKATYTDYGNNTGSGQAVELTPDSGYFWFFDAANVEAVGKVVSFCPVNGSFGFYAGGLTDVGVVMTVRDTVANQTQTFTNDRGHNFDMISSAFNTCGQ